MMMKKRWAWHTLHCDGAIFVCVVNGTSLLTEVLGDAFIISLAAMLH